MIIERDGEQISSAEVYDKAVDANRMMAEIYRLVVKIHREVPELRMPRSRKDRRKRK